MHKPTRNKVESVSIPPQIVSIAINHLSYAHHDGAMGLDDISITLPLNAVTIISGRNGAGKTLLGQALTGFLSGATGTVEIVAADGATATHPLQILQQICGIVFQHAEQQVIGQTVAEDIAFGLKNLNYSAAEITTRTNAMLQRCKISHLATRHPLTLSGGELRRVAIAAMLALTPRLLILDEPFANLDWQGTVELLTLLQSLRTTAVTPIIISHNIVQVAPLAERMIILHVGKLVASGKPSQVMTSAVAHALLSQQMATTIPWVC